MSDGLPWLDHNLGVDVECSELVTVEELVPVQPLGDDVSLENAPEDVFIVQQHVRRDADRRYEVGEGLGANNASVRVSLEVASVFHGCDIVQRVFVVDDDGKSRGDLIGRSDEGEGVHGAVEEVGQAGVP